MDPYIRSSRKQLAGILLSAMDAIITLDADQRIILFNPAAEQMFRCPAAEAIGQPISRFIPERFRAAHHAHVEAFGHAKVTNRRMGALGTISGLRADGEEFPAEASIAHVEAGGQQLFTVILRDITERRKAEIALRESEERFNAFMDHSPAVAFLKDTQGHYVYVNRMYEQCFNRQSPDVLGKTDFELWPPQTAHQFHDNDALVLVTDSPVEKIEMVPDPDGGLQEWLVLKFPVRDESGRRYIGCVGVDLSERKKLEAQLRHTERLAELGTLASGMAHEIGTPMNVILGRAEFLQRKTKDPDTAKGLQTIIDQVERITKIMNQLLLFARRRPIERRPTNLNKVVEETLDMMQERFKRHRIEVAAELAPSLPMAAADPVQISQVVLNLAINALHAIGDGGTLRIRIAVVPVQSQADDFPTDMIEISVSDTGHGIAPEDLDKIFNPFFTTKEAGKGTGLGLTVVHGIVQEHGGHIRVESEFQQGTTFRVFLPIAP